MIHNQRAKALFFLLTHPSVLHQGHFLFPEVFPCSRRSFPVPERSLDNSRQPLNRGDAYPFPMLFAPSEHKIEDFVRFYPPGPPFSGISSTKSRFLCAFTLRDPHFRAFRAQNREFCALLAFGTLVFGHFEHKIVIYVLEQRDKWHREA